MSNFLRMYAGIEKDIFLSHAHGKDRLGRDNHVRVQLLAAQLKQEGLQPWLDSDQMAGNIETSMIEGITNSSYVALCITAEYLKKISSRNTADNCFKEFDFAVRNKQKESIIMIFMDHVQAADWPESLEDLYRPNEQLYVEFRMDEKVKDCASEVHRLIGIKAINEVLKQFQCECGRYTEILHQCCYSDELYCEDCAVPCRGYDCEAFIANRYISCMANGEFSDSECPFCTDCGMGNNKAYCPDCLTEALAVIVVKVDITALTTSQIHAAIAEEMCVLSIGIYVCAKLASSVKVVAKIG
eukprot:CAMPEP_0173167074 /NCGR_PEP_ID=MMETSP1105-20130129/22449_1 /TAXON_ID=2985 /ORGANISM="Ochromonas sp., Strain BG-1" /LENGTH=298 /DNA_ID=CAMNT_0014088551 /DNA_START=271 /DNA_END=1165 /DNA_ORIENTATION=+